MYSYLNSYLHAHHVYCGQTQMVAFWKVDLQPCKTMIDMLAPVECTNWVLLAWNSTPDKNDVLSA